MALKAIASSFSDGVQLIPLAASRPRGKKTQEDDCRRHGRSDLPPSSPGTRSEG